MISKGGFHIVFFSFLVIQIFPLLLTVCTQLYCLYWLSPPFLLTHLSFFFFLNLYLISFPLLFFYYICICVLCISLIFSFSVSVSVTDIFHSSFLFQYLYLYLLSLSLLFFFCVCFLYLSHFLSFFCIRIWYLFQYLYLTPRGEFSRIFRDSSTGSRFKTSGWRGQTFLKMKSRAREFLYFILAPCP